jgi:hypothetical protein
MTARGFGSAGGSMIGETLFDAGEDLAEDLYDDWRDRNRMKTDATRRAIEQREADLRRRYGR